MEFPSHRQLLPDEYPNRRVVKKDESLEEREGRSGSREVCRALGLLLVLLSPFVMVWGLGQYDLSRCFVYGGSDPKCVKGEEMMGVGLKVGAAMLVGGAVLLLISKLISKGESANAADSGPRQTAMERYLSDLLERRRQGTISEAHYQTRLEEVRRLARLKAEEAITDDEVEAAAARLLDAKTDRPIGKEIAP